MSKRFAKGFIVHVKECGYVHELKNAWHGDYLGWQPSYANYTEDRSRAKLFEPGASLNRIKEYMRFIDTKPEVIVIYTTECPTCHHDHEVSVR